MSRARRITLMIALAVYLAVGLAALYLFAPDAEAPKANKDFITVYSDSLHNVAPRRAHKYDSVGAVWKAEREARKARREYKRDSARHHWDSVRAVRDSIKARRDSVHSALKTTPDRPVNLATAAADSLMLVPGIGEVLSRQIVDYRNRLGGFVSIRQVLEIKHVPDTALEYLFLPVKVVERLNINRESLQRLRRHPYISGEQAIAICEARRKTGKIAGWNQLLRLPEFTPGDQDRLAPYIVF